jgi:D-xylose 1-dehydrogenase (NADP+, D-xylono-1,5-lactone-forming)
MSVQWGVLSTARINEKFLAGVSQSDECDVLAVASRDAGRAAAYARANGIARSYGSYEQLLDDPDVEVVYISLPNALHLEWTEAALRKGKHVLCEKPLSRRVADVEAAFAVARSADRLLMEAFMWRHNPQTDRVVEIVRAGAIGRPTLVRAAFSFPIDAGDAANVRLSAELEGGALMDVGCYCVSAARLLAGEPEAVSGLQLTGGDGVDVAFAGAMRFGSGVLAHFDAGLALAARDELEVVGDEASLFLDDPWHCLEPVIELRRDGAVERIELEAANSYRLEAENLSAAIRGRAEPRLGRADAVGQARAIEALYADASRRGDEAASGRR